MLPDTVFQEIFVLRFVETTSKHLAKHAMMEILPMETDAAQLAPFSRVITVSYLDQRVFAVLVRAASITVLLARTVQVFHAPHAHLDAVYLEIPVFKCVEIILKHQAKAVMMEIQ